MKICLEPDTDRALYGHGDLELLPAYVKRSHRVTADSWLAMSEAQKQKAADA